MKRVCAVCKDTVYFDKENSKRAIQYKGKNYHYDCFVQMCEAKKANKKCSPMWGEALANIDELVAQTTMLHKVNVAKDDLFQWVTAKYEISYLSEYMYKKLDEIYNGVFKGLAYPIGPQELLDEWKYYWSYLCSCRSLNGLSGERAINYDLSILLSKNYEYRDIKLKEQIAKEIQKQQEAETIDSDAFFTMVRKNAIQKKPKVADLYQEMVGEGNGE